MSWARQIRAQTSERLPAVVAATRTGVAPETKPMASRMAPTTPNAIDALRAGGRPFDLI